MNKPRVIKDFDKLDSEIQEQIKLIHPYGFDKSLISFKNAKNKFVSALPFEAEDRYYLVRMTREEAQDIIEEDDDYDTDGVLKDEVRDEYSEKYDDELEEVTDEIPDVAEEDNSDDD
ncbi:MAG: hypothetical protein ACI9FN_002318 [Saprospiraceae bacterium]|jgi:hypothetical protein